MSLQLVAILAAAAVLGAFAISRVVRVRSGREARVYGWKMWVLVLVALVGVPVLLAMSAPAPGPRGASPVVELTILYIGALVFFATLMGIAAAVVRRVVFGPVRPTLLLALIGREPSVADVPVDPPMTDEIRKSVDLVDVRNAAFPRGREFMDQTELPGFQAAWSSLDEATRGLEGLIAEGTGLGTGVAMHATDTAGDARSRLDTLHRAALARGKAWAV